MSAALEPWVAFTLLGALLFALGNALQKFGLAGSLVSPRVQALAAQPLRLLRAFARSRAWLLGTALTLVAVAAETQALALGEASAVKPLSAIQSLFVIAIGITILGERLARREWLGVLIMLCGVWALALEPGDAHFVARSAGATVALGIGVAGSVALAAALSDRHPARPAGEWSPALAAGAFFGLGDVMMKVATESVHVRIGGFDLSRADTLAALVSTPGFHLGVGLTAAAFLLQQLAFSRGRVSLSAPVVGVGATAFVVVLGVAFLGESFGAGRSLGVGLTVLGTWLLARNEEANPRPATA
jgi:uncharacterized membrane protein